MTDNWERLAFQQSGLVARKQFAAIGVDANRVRNQVAAGRWAVRSNTVISTFTGELTWSQRCWLGVLHGGPSSLVGGISAATIAGLRRWDRDTITILVDHRRSIEPVEGFVFVRTRRPLGRLRRPGGAMPTCAVEPAILLEAAYRLSKRSAQGLVAAVVQQRVTTAERLLHWLDELAPLHRAKLLRAALTEIAGGAQSMGEIDVARMCRSSGLPAPTRQRRRRDSSGRIRYTDCEWDLETGHTVVLEVDGGFHMHTEHWEADIVRQRGLTDVTRLVVRCTARELRDEPWAVARDLQRLGVVGAAKRRTG